jgi:hydrogenase maturation protease
VKGRSSILLGLGNPIMSDDGIGLVVSEAIHGRLPGFVLDMSSAGGFDVVDRILGYGRAVIIDSMVTGRYPRGTVVRIDNDASIETVRIGHSHGIDFVRAIELARSCGAAVPEEVVIYGIEVADPFSIGEEISAVLLENLESIVDHIVRDFSESR